MYVCIYNKSLNAREWERNENSILFTNNNHLRTADIRIYLYTYVYIDLQENLIYTCAYTTNSELILFRNIHITYNIYMCMRVLYICT